MEVCPPPQSDPKFGHSIFQEEEFLAGQKNYLDTMLKSIIVQNKRETCETERQCLDKKQNLLRGEATPRNRSQSDC